MEVCVKLFMSRCLW